nr:coiled-coil domain-containing protein 157-like [Pelodiscus sinensis]|eukprot:XP_025042940.1 coiled-coil domain-containing protein 157-like [Pelodiscus sinensis]
MAKQLQANNIRISVLEEENSRLRAARGRMKEAAQQGALRLIPQTQLWPPSSRIGSKDGAVGPPGSPALARQPPASQRPPKPASATASCISLPARRVQPHSAPGSRNRRK